MSQTRRSVELVSKPPSRVAADGAPRPPRRRVSRQYGFSRRGRLGLAADRTRFEVLKPLLVCVVSLFTATSGMASAQESSAPPPQQFHARRLGDASPPPAKIDVMAWLAGRWEGEGLGGFNEEIWSRPRDGVMMGMFRNFKQDKTVFYEFLMFVEENGSVVLKLKHFNPDFSGWEEKQAFVSFKLVKVEDRAVHFDGLSFVRESDDSLRIYLLLRDKSGQVREEAFAMRRVL